MNMTSWIIKHSANSNLFGFFSGYPLLKGLLVQKIKDYFKPLVPTETCNRGKIRDYDYGYFYTKYCDYDYD